jgi:NADH-quinone oxidoreductase subunit N
MSQLQSIDYVALAPALVAALAAVVVLLADLAVPLRSRRAVLWVAVAGAAGCLAASLALIGDRRATFCTPAATLPGDVAVGPSCSYVVDGFTVFLLVLLSAAAFGALLLSVRYAADTTLPAGEYGFLLLASLTGALVVVGARDLITLLVGLETLTLPTYALVGLRRGSRAGAEAAVKYLLVSITATAVSLLGVAFVYGLTGAVHLDRIAAAFEARPDVRALPLAAAAVVLVLAVFGFKIAAVPFHWWAPDVYLGAPVPVAAYLATVSKVAGVAGLLLVTVEALPAFGHVWAPVLAVLAAASMTLGNLVALRQRQAVRLLAWSSVAHAGYLLVPLGALGASGDPDALSTVVAATLGYLALYVPINLGAFGCVTAVGRVHPGNALEDYRGLAQRSPLLASATAFFLLGLAGLPPTIAGLVAKVVVLRAALLGGSGWLAVAVAVNTVIGLAYYLRLAALSFRAEVEAGVAAGAGAEAEAEARAGAGSTGPSGSVASAVGARPRAVPIAASLGVAIVASAVIVLFLGVAPQLVLDAPPLP